MTIYWLGKTLNQLPGYTGPELDLSAFQNLVGGQVSQYVVLLGLSSVLNTDNSI